ncbi:MAG: Mth938-like domain-containing protein [Cocleimonas sp.]|nr:Mth938-like domain-containing protein [Cocleimonas sp.]
MKFSEEHDDTQFTITGYDDQSVRINDNSFNQGFILTPNHFNSDWQPQTFIDLQAQHLEAIFALQPEVILLGTGIKQVFPEKEIYLNLVNSGIGFEVMNTQAACRTFNILMADDRNVAAALFCK